LLLCREQVRDEDGVVIAAFLSGMGLAASSGLNAYLPLLILALADRFSGIVDLEGRWSLLSSSWTIIGLLVILPLELIGDKIPRFDHINDRIHTMVRPIAGGICMAAVASQANGYNTIAALVVGLCIAGAVHRYKFRVRPAITKATAGIGNPIMSMVEDAAVVVTSVAASLLPFGVIVILPLAAWFVWKSSASLQSPAGRLGFLYRGRR
jgi:hypothetical protein